MSDNITGTNRTAATFLASHTQDNGDAVLDGVRVNRTAVFVQFTEVNAVDSVVLLDPDGVEFGTRSPELGEQSVRFTVISSGPDDPYDPGTYSAVALDETGEEIDELQFDLEPNLSVVGFETWQSSSPLVVIRNEGTGPAYVDSVSVVEGMPDGISTWGLGQPFRRRQGPPVRPGATITIQLQEDLQFDSEEEAARACGETFETTFQITTDRGTEITDTLEIGFEGEPTRVEQFTADEFVCEYVSGGEVRAYDG